MIVWLLWFLCICLSEMIGVSHQEIEDSLRSVRRQKDVNETSHLEYERSSAGQRGYQKHCQGTSMYMADLPEDAHLAGCFITITAV
jgi:hypothetical protein